MPRALGVRLEFGPPGTDEDAGRLLPNDVTGEERATV